ncbi:transcription regulator [Bacteroidia bacterium]|nr:transcription regulator [Bacteroidia bacterium]
MPMNILNLDEHTSCCNYGCAYKNGFKSYKFVRGQELSVGSDHFNRILFVLKGEVTLYTETGTYSVTKDVIRFLPANSAYRMVAVADAKIIVNYFEQTVELCNSFSMDKLVPLLSCDTDKEPTLAPNTMLTDFLNTLVIYFDNNANCKLLHEIKQKELFFIFRFFYQGKDLATFLAPIIGDHLTFKKNVLNNYTKITSVKELARSCNCSMSSFIRHFRAAFNEQPLVWLQEQKLAMIMKMLSNHDIPLFKIIDELGFSSASHFTGFCKRYLGMTPSQYRKSATRPTDSVN